MDRHGTLPVQLLFGAPYGPNVGKAGAGTLNEHTWCRGFMSLLPEISAGQSTAQPGGRLSGLRGPRVTWPRRPQNPSTGAPHDIASAAEVTGP